MHDQALQEAAWGWDASPISTARMSAELWNLIKKKTGRSCRTSSFRASGRLRLWDFEKHYQFIGGHGAYGDRLRSPGRSRRGAGQS